MTSGYKFLLYTSTTLTALITGVWLYSREPAEVTSAAFEAWLIDADSGQPLEGAHVLAVWELFHQGIHGSFFRQVADVREAVSDKNGRFAFPQVTLANPERHTLVGDPAVYVFKSGYEIRSTSGSCGLEEPCKKPRVSSFASQRVALRRIPKKFFEPNDDKSKVSHSVYEYLDSRGVKEVVEACATNLAPQFYMAAELEFQRLKALGFNDWSLPAEHSVKNWLGQCKNTGPKFRKENAK